MISLIVQEKQNKLEARKKLEYKRGVCNMSNQGEAMQSRTRKSI